MLRNSSELTRSNIGDQRSKSGLPDTIANLYYKHGLFLSSYPTCASSIAIVALLFCCYPLINIPLPGTIPTKVVLPFEGRYSLLSEKEKNFSGVKNIFNVNNLSYEPPFPWAQSNPMVFIQQILLRSSVIPWSDDMQLMDAFRSPLYEVFKLIEIIRNHESDERITLDHICLHVENVKRPQNNVIFPQYNCLVLSPANLWSQNVHNFTKDVNILNSVFQYHNLQKSKVSIAEMLIGLPIQDSGFKRYPLRSRSRVIQYAITLILKTNNKEYLKSLKEKLVDIYPMHQAQSVAEINLNDRKDQQSFKKRFENNSYIMYIYYPGEFKILEFLPICTAFLLLFTYIHFSVRKINVIRSRLILALCSVFTVLGSLMMSLGLCFFFGLTISLQSKEIFPYLVILVGLENCLVITKSVVSTDETFDIKIRIAQALSKEGWHITKTLLTEITILTIGLSTFVPVIQEFCVFAIVGLLSDFMLQMLFFSTILAMNIKRIEYTMEAKNLPKKMSYSTVDSKRIEFKYFSNSTLSIENSPSSFHRSHSHPKLTILNDKINTQDNFCSSKRTSMTLKNNEQKHKIPKRLKLVNFWARTRFFQRAFMIWMSVWIFSIIYNSGFLESFFIIDVNNTNSRQTHIQRNVKMNGIISKMNLPKKFGSKNLKNVTENSTMENDFTHNVTEQLEKLRFPNFDLNYFLSNFHWSAIMKQYNISLCGRYVTILPTIKLSHAIKPEEAKLLRNSKEKLTQNFQWKALAAALDPLDFSDDENRDSPLITSGSGGTPLYPKSPMEICLAVMLCTISLFVLCYTMVVFYRCICTRNYAEWRSSWNESEFLQQNTEQILEGVPIQIAGHSNRIECLVSDGTNIVSSCLKGQIKVWDTKSGELLTEIDRSILNSLGKTQNNCGNFISKNINTSPIWCLDYIDNLVAVGCANGRMEFWETPTGSLKCTYNGELKQGQGITHINLNADRVIVARLNGMINFYRLETYYKGKQIDWGFTSAYRRTHVRTGSTGSISLMHRESSEMHKGAGEEMKCSLEGVRCAHQQPITCMEVVNGTVLIGSQDHTLKVYCVENSWVEYTLHGHCGPITCLFIDRWQPGTGGSGSQDGFLCVWDLCTGACMYNIQAHDGSISSLACAPSYVISIGTDERICVWERFQGNLLNAINISNAYSNLLMLTPSLLVTTKLGSLIIWDVRTGEPAREVKLDCSNSQLCPKIILLAGNSVVCDYGNTIRVVRFPLVDDKCN